MKGFRLFIFCMSFSVHVLVGYCLSLIQVEPPVPKNAIDHYVEFVDAPKPRAENEKAFTRQSDLPDELLTKDDTFKRRFISERDQTVLQETRAAESGLTKNRSQTLPNPKNRLGALAPQLSRGRPPAGVPGFEDGIVGGETQPETGRGDEGKELDFPAIARFGLEHGRSTFGEMAPNDLKIGNMTALNTDRFLYYSFYERAQELVYHHWAKYVRAVLYSYQRTGHATGDEYWITRIEIVLDKNGKFLKGMLHQGSGLQSLDLAPVHAFRDAKQIPHPPPEMIKEDGTIRMDWEFAVQMIPTYASGK